jgi:hypothetical protein
MPRPSAQVQIHQVSRDGSPTISKTISATAQPAVHTAVT